MTREQERVLAQIEANDPHPERGEIKFGTNSVAEHTGITEDLSDDANDSKYILVAEDRSQVSYGDDVGDMQVVRSIADDGSIDGVSVSDLTDDTAQAVPKFEKEPSGQSAKTGKSRKPKPTIDKDYDIPILEPFLRNFVRFARYGDYRLWLVPVLSQGIKGISAGIDLSLIHI